MSLLGDFTTVAIDRLAGDAARLPHSTRRLPEWVGWYLDGNRSALKQSLESVFRVRVLEIAHGCCPTMRPSEDDYHYVRFGGRIDM